ncbi:hypothetical protein RRG08_062308 [Elysia crispata]|uniref:Uncharacterized protein n=1 Tax=Elysia crispata TaxID=231223 RepID=A0AAE0YGC3_9GAST|nr:hypothetical protein RRG08_062308 [Elysia crispata]
MRNSGLNRLRQANREQSNEYRPGLLVSRVTLLTPDRRRLLASFYKYRHENWAKGHNPSHSTENLRQFTCH